MGSSLGIDEIVNVRDALGGWHSVVVLVIGFVVVIAYLKFFTSLERLQSTREVALDLAQNNKERIRALKKRIEDGQRHS